MNCKMSKSNLNTDYSSIDFDFFEIDGDHPNHSSKIITKAVIETNPTELSKSTKKPLKTTSVNLNTVESKEMLTQINPKNLLSSLNSSEETVHGVAESDQMLFNCLAFNDETRNNQMCTMEDIDFSDNSLSDSTITTVTSDLTSVSRMSSTSDSSCGSDLSNDSHSLQSESLRTKKNNTNCSYDTENVNIELSTRVESTLDESTTEETYKEDKNCVEPNDNNCVKLTNSEHEFFENDSNAEGHESRGTTTDSERSTSNDNIYKPSAYINTDIESTNTNKKESSKGNHEHSGRLSRKASTSSLEERLGGISLASQSSSNPSTAKCHSWRGQNRFRLKRKELNLTFSREQLIKIERDNTILLKKIMTYSKPRSVVLNHTLGHKKTSAAINRARQQKKIEQDNYILYSKINAMNRTKKVF